MQLYFVLGLPNKNKYRPSCAIFTYPSRVRLVWVITKWHLRKIISKIPYSALSHHSKASSTSRTKFKNLNVSRLVLYPIHWRQVLSREWRCGCVISLQWRHYERDGVSNYQHLDRLLNRLLRRRSKKTPKLRVTGLFAGDSSMTGEFPAQMASNAENVSNLMTSSCIRGFTIYSNCVILLVGLTRKQDLTNHPQFRQVWWHYIQLYM